MSGLLETIFQLVQQLIEGAPWWVYLLLFLAPICMSLAVREGFCWFWKINTLVNRLERIEKRLAQLPSPEQSPRRPSKKKVTKGKAKKSSIDDDFNDEFTME